MPTTLDELGISSGGSWRSPSSSTTASPVATRIPLVKALCAPKARVWVTTTVRGSAAASFASTSRLSSGLPSLTKMIS